MGHEIIQELQALNARQLPARSFSTSSSVSSAFRRRFGGGRGRGQSVGVGGGDGKPGFLQVRNVPTHAGFELSVGLGFPKRRFVMLARGVGGGEGGRGAFG